MVSSARSAVFIIFTLLVNDFKVVGQMRTLYFGPPPKPVPGEHWIQAAVRELSKQRCTGAPACPKEEPLGMEDGRILDESITASSYYRNNWAGHGPVRARLNTQGRAAAWVVGSGDINPWIQVDFTTTVTVTGLITQGRWDDPYADQRVTKYQVAQSDDGQSWDHVTYTNGTAITFPGNIDSNSYVTTRFPMAMHTRFIRILPTEWNAYCSMRFEVIGCY